MTLARNVLTLSDSQLLEAFVCRENESAFEAILQRHGPMVLGVCRRILRNPYDAEDAFQAAFLVFVRKAASISRPEALSNWLYGVAYRTALQAKAASQRKRFRERELTGELEPVAPQPENDNTERRALLDMELSRLPDKCRLPIVLCDLEENSIKEAAHRLGWPIGTLAGRLSRGRMLLAKRLARHGLAVSGGIVAASLGQGPVSARLHARLLVSTAKLAHLYAAGEAAELMSFNAALLAKGALKSMWTSKTIFAIAMVFASALLCVAIGLVGHRTFAGEPGLMENSAIEEEALVNEAEPDSYVVYLKQFSLRDDDSVIAQAQPLVLRSQESRSECAIRPNDNLFVGLAARPSKEKHDDARFEIRIRRAAEKRVHVDLSVSTYEVQNAETDNTLILGNSLRTVQVVELDKPAKIVLARDRKGKSERWVELIVKVDRHGPMNDVPSASTAKLQRIAFNRQLNEQWATLMRQYKDGQGTLNKLQLTAEMLFRREIVEADAQRERIAVRESDLSRKREISSVVGEKYRSGRAVLQDYLDSRAAASMAEMGLEKEKARRETPDDSLVACEQWLFHRREFVEGKGTQDVLFESARVLLQIQLREAPGKKETISVWEAHLGRMRELSRIAKERYESGRVAVQEYAQARTEVVLAESGLEKAKAQ